MAADLEPARAAALAAARSFRLGMDAQGNEAFVAFVDAVQPALAASPTLAAAVSPLLGPLLAAQERADTLRMADLLEFEIRPRLEEKSSAGG
ncbi:MAG: hypothetical protein AB1726_06670 [Planctomycetota bacterium]